MVKYSKLLAILCCRYDSLLTLQGAVLHYIHTGTILRFLHNHHVANSIREDCI